MQLQLVLAALACTSTLAKPHSLSASLVEHAGRLKHPIGKEVLAAMESAEELGATPAVKDTFRKLIAMIKDPIEKKIKEAHVSDQADVTKAKDALKTATDAANAKRGIAITTDTLWGTCVGQEDQLLTDLKQCLGEQADDQQEAINACNISNGTRYRSYDIIKYATENTFQCDFYHGKNCKTEFATWTQRLKDYIKDDVKDGLIADADSDHDEKKNECYKKANEEDTKRKECIRRTNDWRRKIQTCDSKDSNRKTQICLFGKDFQTQCQKLIDYNGAVSTASGLDSDRQGEWRVLQDLECLMQGYLDNSAANKIHKFDKVALKKCTDVASGFASEVGVLDILEAEKNTIMGTSQYTCQTASFTFSEDGNDWTISPAALDARTIDGTTYTEAAFSHPVKSMDEGTDPFDVCS